MVRRKGTAHPDQPNARMQPAQSGDDIQQHVDALARNRAADVQQLDMPATGADRAATRPVDPRRAPVSRAVQGMHAVWHDDDTFGRNRRRRDQLVARGCAPAQDLPRRFHPVEESPAECPLDDRTAVRSREHAAKRVQIVAGDERPACWQVRRQMRIAVVDDVEEIEVSDPGAKPSRVVPDAVEDPIRGVRGRCFSDERQPGETSHHRGPHLGRVDEPRLCVSRLSSSISATRSMRATALREGPQPPPREASSTAHSCGTSACHEPDLRAQVRARPVERRGQRSHEIEPRRHERPQHAPVEPLVIVKHGSIGAMKHRTNDVLRRRGEHAR